MKFRTARATLSNSQKKRRWGKKVWNNRRKQPHSQLSRAPRGSQRLNWQSRSLRGPLHQSQGGLAGDFVGLLTVGVGGVSDSFTCPWVPFPPRLPQPTLMWEGLILVLLHLVMPSSVTTRRPALFWREREEPWIWERGEEEWRNGRRGGCSWDVLHERRMNF